MIRQPQITKLPIDKIINCDQNILVEFYNWINTNGGAIATDNCSSVIWSADYLKEPTEPCEDVNAIFIASDSCGNEVSALAKFIKWLIQNRLILITKLPYNPNIKLFYQLHMTPSKLDIKAR